MRSREVAIYVPKGSLGATLSSAADSRRFVVFAHGSGSSRFSSRNRFVARELNEAGFATVLMDLLTQSEDGRDRATAEFRFNVQLLAERLSIATGWLRNTFGDAALSIGYFGASTGAGAALLAAAAKDAEVAAVVSRGGRPDLAGAALEHVAAPTLLIVGENDPEVLELNRQAEAALRCRSELAVVPGATHLFEEPGALERVAALASAWFLQYLPKV